MDRELRRKVEYAFYNYLQLRQRGAEYIEEIAEKGLTASYEGVGGAKSGNSVENRVIAGLAKSEAYKWAKVVENTMIAFRWQGEEELIRLKYFTKWNRIATQLKLGISDRTYDYWVENICIVALRWARELYLL